jgi:PPM family protein phosphatase
MIEIVFAGKSDTGLRRNNNEDAFFYQPSLGVAALADGMGGAAAGEKASAFFIEAVLEAFGDGGAGTRDDMVRLVRTSFETANQKILDHVIAHPEHSGMGCTGELLVFYGKSFAIGHIGDSRAYLFRNRSLRQLTRDHSFVQDELDRGLITAAEAREHPLRHVIMRAIGMGTTLDVDVITGEISHGDAFLLCSDGLTDMIEDATVAQLLASPHDLSARVKGLIEAANLAGGKDNITAVLGEVTHG